MYIEILFKRLLFRGGVHIYAEHCIYLFIYFLRVNFELAFRDHFNRLELIINMIACILMLEFIIVFPG